MAIFWGPYTNVGAGLALRTGLEMFYNPTAIDTNTSAVTVTMRVLLSSESNYWATGSNGNWELGGAFADWGGIGSWTLNTGQGYIVIAERQVVVGLQYGTTTDFGENARVKPSGSWGWTGYVGGTITLPARPYYAPRAPYNVTVTRVNDNTQTVRWTNKIEPGGPYQSVEVWRSVNGSAFDKIAWIPTTESFTDYNTAPGNIYRYAIKGYNSSGVSDASPEASISTTPLQPTAPSVQKDASSNIVITRGSLSTSAVSWRIWHYANDVRDASPLVTLSASTSSWTYANPNTSVTHSFAIEAVSENPTLYSALSPKSATVQLLAPPNPPTPMSPVGGVSDVADGVTLIWRHNPVDMTPQSKYEVQYREVGSSTWTSSGIVSSSTSSHVLTGLSNNKKYEWQVRTWGSHATASPWSTVATFSLLAKPVVGIVSPASGVITTSTATLDWSYYQEKGSPQTQWQIKLLRVNQATGVETTVAEWYGEGEVTEFTTPAIFQNGVKDYVWRVRSYSADGLWSAWSSSQLLTVSYTPPLAPTVTSDWNESFGHLELHIVANSDGVAPNAVSVTLERSTDNGYTWATLGTNLSPSLDYLDWTVPLTEGTIYRITSFAASGATTVVEYRPQIERIASECAAYVSGGANFAMLIPLRFSDATRVSMGRKRVLNRFEGREYPVETSSYEQDYVLSVSVYLLPLTGCAEADAGKTTYQALESLMRLPGPHLYRDRERTFMCSLSDLSYVDEYAGKAAFSVTRVEPVSPEQYDQIVSSLPATLVYLGDGRYTISGGDTSTTDNGGEWTWLP